MSLIFSECFRADPVLLSLALWNHDSPVMFAVGFTSKLIREWTLRTGRVFALSGQASGFSPTSPV